ncbi:MAG: response regulator, partial [Deltaproteobacteria bacterium]|nr:response regulator [Deltaproteobacteria bacterium]
ADLGELDHVPGLFPGHLAGELGHGRRYDVVGWRKDGAMVHLELAVNTLHDQAGTTYIGVLHDISQRKALELAQDGARREAERLAQLRSDFLANMSHEIRTPLGAVIGLARIGAREPAGSQARDLCLRILQAGNHLQAVVNDILDMSKLEAGKMLVEAQPLRLADLVDATVAMVAEPARDKGLLLRAAIDTGLPEWVVGDGQRIQQILANLLSNAVKFSDHGTIELRVHQSADRLCLAVSDQGVGMAPEHVARLFRPFEQADSSTSRQFGGTGLGLAISQNLARLMQGVIEVASELGLGSTFTLNLPLVATEAPPQALSAAAPEADGQPLSGLAVLVVDDVEVNRMIIDDMLTLAGAECVLADNGLLAVDLVQARPHYFHIVLMDLQMPVLDGYAAAQRVRQASPTLPIVALTAHALPAERAKCLAAGMVAVVTKPIDPSELLACVKYHHRPTRGPHATEPRSARAPAGTGHQAAVEPPHSETNAGPNAGLEAGSAASALGMAAIDWRGLLAQHQDRSAFVLKLLNLLVTSHSDTPARLRQARQALDLPALAFAAHDLISVAGTLHASALSAFAREVAHRAKAGDTAALQQCEILADAVEELLAEARAHLAARPGHADRG